jgi:chromate transporter
MLLPGPEAQQLAIYIGWLLHKTWGGIVAGAFFVVPSIFILWGGEFHLRRLRQRPVDRSAFFMDSNLP